MFKHSFRKECVKLIGTISLVLSLGHLIMNIFDYCFTFYMRSSSFGGISYSLTLLFASIFLVLANLPISFKVKIFPHGISDILDVYLKVLMLLGVGETLFWLRYSFLETPTLTSHKIQRITFALFFILLYLYNKGKANKYILVAIGASYITMWVTDNIEYLKIRQLQDYAPIVVIVMLLLYITSFPTLTSGFYYYSYDHIKFNGKKVNMICISAMKNKKNETELLMKTEDSDFVIYNRKTKTTIEADLDLLIDDKLYFLTDLVTFSLNSRSYIN